MIIRVGIFPTNYLGHMIYEYETYVEPKKKPGQRLTIDIFCTQPNISNTFLQDRLEGEIRIWPRFIVLPVYFTNRLLGSKLFIRRMATNFELDGAASVFMSPSKFKFTDSEVKHGEILIEALGWERGQSIITLLLRSQKYRSQHLSPKSTSATDFRDVSEVTYFPLIAKLADSSFTKILGLNSEIFSPLKLSKYDVEFLNYFLVHRSQLCITSDSGSSLIPFLLRTTTVQTNITATALLKGVPGNLVLPITYVDLMNDHKISLSELIENKVYQITQSEEFRIRNIGMKQAENSELLSISQEIIEVSKGTWEPSELNDEIYNRVSSRFGPEFPNLYQSRFFNNWVEKNLWFFK
jgi:putative glycosyltransferase (TIGR04372 family)